MFNFLDHKLDIFFLEIKVTSIDIDLSMSIGEEAVLNVCAITYGF